MTPFEEEMYRALQDIRNGTNPFSSAEEDTATDIQLIADFAKKWDFKDLYLKEHQQLEDLEKKAVQDRIETAKATALEVIKEFLPIIDSAQQLQSHLNDQTLKFIVDQMLKLLSSRGGGVILPKVGETFNPSLHSAITAERSAQHRGNVIAEILRAGYFVGNQIIRPAEVRVWIGS